MTSTRILPIVATVHLPPGTRTITAVTQTQIGGEVLPMIYSGYPVSVVLPNTIDQHFPFEPLTRSDSTSSTSTSTPPSSTAIATSISTSSSSPGALPSPSPLSSSSPPQGSSSPSSSSTIRIGLGLGLGLGIPLVLLAAGVLFYMIRSHLHARATPEPDAGYMAGDAVPNSSVEKSSRPLTPIDTNAMGNVEQGPDEASELHGNHVPPYTRELPGTPTSHRSELP